jgi:insecticidal toxin complex protein TccC
VAALEGGRLDFNFVGSSFGELSLQDVNYLIRGYRGMIADIEEIKNNQERLVFVSGGTRIASMRKGDEAHRIYINISNFFEHSKEQKSHILGHELTHLSAVFQSEDFWYLSKEPDESWFKVLVYSNSIMQDGDKHFDLNSKSERVFISRAGMRDVIEAREKFNNSSAFRTRLALHNADTLMNFPELINNLR